jgi:N-acetylneuraminic acid mutarotase
VSRPGATLQRIVLAALVAVIGITAVALLAGDDEADGKRDRAGWTTLTSSPLSRSEVGAARIGRSLYVLGGFAVPSGATTDQMARYDIRSGAWSITPPMPVAVNHPAVATAGGRLFVYGGYTAAGALNQETDALQRYDPGSGTWAMLAGSGTKRGAATLAHVGSRLYAIGGAGGGSALNLLQVYDLRRGGWSGGPPMRTAREHLASAVIGDRIFVLGGRSAGGNLDTVEVLNTRTRKWSRLPHLLTARSGFGAASVEGRVVAVGGEQLAEGDQTIAPVEMYLPHAKRWRRLPAMLTPRHGLGVVSLKRTVIAAEGGPQPGLSFSNTLEALKVPPSKERP